MIVLRLFGISLPAIQAERLVTTSVLAPAANRIAKIRNQFIPLPHQISNHHYYGFRS